MNKEPKPSRICLPLNNSRNQGQERGVFNGERLEKRKERSHFENRAPSGRLGLGVALKWRLCVTRTCDGTSQRRKEA